MIERWPRPLRMGQTDEPQLLQATPVGNLFLAGDIHDGYSERMSGGTLIQWDFGRKRIARLHTRSVRRSLRYGLAVRAAVNAAGS